MKLSENDIRLTIAIPSYKRPIELGYLLNTIYDSSDIPFEIAISDDNSGAEYGIEELCISWRSKFEHRGVRCSFSKNPQNIGYDRNIRKLINMAAGDYVTLLGNDDALTKEGIGYLKRYLAEAPHVFAISRTFVRFKNSLNEVVGISRFAGEDQVFDVSNSKPNVYFRLGAFFSGITFDRQWAISKDTDQYDGTLYYQIYLSACAYYESGIGYISFPIVGGRVDGIPLFGNSATERGSHVPGSYSAKARANMWTQLLRIARDIDGKYGVDSYRYIAHELKTRMSFHVLEMYCHKNVSELLDLFIELRKLQLVFHPLPLSLFILVLVFRGNARFFFSMVRRMYQK